jgi:uncharacterized protein (TIGR03067 family)
MTHIGAFIAAIGLATGALMPQAKDATAIAALQGIWQITSLNDQSMPPEGPSLTLTFAGDKYHQTVGGGVNERGSFKLDAAMKPMNIDLVITEGDDAGKTQLGIIEITGDTIRASLATPGATQRPTDFSVKDGAVVIVGKKTKP